MDEYILLILDRDCKIMEACVERGTEHAIIAKAPGVMRDYEANGYELWRGGRRIAAYYDCNETPGTQTGLKQRFRPEIR